MKATLQRMQERWRLTLWRTVAVLVAFSLAGTSTVLVKAPLIAFLLPPDAQRWVQWTVYLVVMVPMYHLFLIGYGTLLGQFEFFWQRMQAVGRLFGKRAAAR
tara:strand:+ start:33 stop:338 length:306 start_codon:yes stop_codon:yes gene_type:complete